MFSVESLIPPAVREIVAGVELTGSVRRAVLGAVHEAAVSREGDDAWERITIAYFPPERALERRTVAEVAEERGVAGEEIVLDLTERSGGKAEIINHCMAQENVDAVAALPFAAVASDGYALHVDGNGSLPHPRSFGTFPRFISRYVVELGLIELEDAVRKVTSMPADLVGLASVGRIAPGARADLVALDLERLADVATFDNPGRLASGIEAIVVGGRVMQVDEHGVREPAGEVLRRT
jgi:N-acyl-D-amino-acid deacylase